MSIKLSQKRHMRRLCDAISDNIRDLTSDGVEQILNDILSKLTKLVNIMFYGAIERFSGKVIVEYNNEIRVTTYKHTSDGTETELIEFVINDDLLSIDIIHNPMIMHIQSNEYVAAVTIALFLSKKGEIIIRTRVHNYDTDDLEVYSLNGIVINLSEADFKSDAINNMESNSHALFKLYKTIQHP